MSGSQASLLAGFMLLLSACQTPPQTRSVIESPPDIARQHLIASLPFIPQQEYFCGPTTLAEVANFYGAQLKPDDIAPNTFIPGRQGSLQIEMVAATRQLGFIAYAQRGNLSQLLSLVSEDIPVIVLQNNAISWWPMWHYAVVAGYDLEQRQIILNTGLTQTHHLSLATFERTWQRANYWMLAMLPASNLSQHLQPFVYTQACQDLLDTGQTSSRLTALTNATRQWPDNWLAYFLLGNYYFDLQPELAAHWYARGLPFARQQVDYLNNYALLLSRLHCTQLATDCIEQARQLAPDDANISDSLQQIRQQSVQSQHDQQTCPAGLTAGQP